MVEKDLVKKRILSSLALEINSPIFNINLKELKKNILTVPWVKSAKVSRKLPNEIHILIEEYEPAAIWEYKNEILILDKDGYHIEKIQKKDIYDDLLFIYGNEADINLNSFLNALQDYPLLIKKELIMQLLSGKEGGTYFLKKVF